MGAGGAGILITLVGGGYLPLEVEPKLEAEVRAVWMDGDEYSLAPDE